MKAFFNSKPFLIFTAIIFFLSGLRFLIDPEHTSNLVIRLIGVAFIIESYYEFTKILLEEK